MKCTRVPLIGYNVDWVINGKDRFIGVIRRGKNTKKYPYNKVFEVEKERK